MKKRLLIILFTLPILFGLSWRSASFFSVKQCYVNQAGSLSQDCFNSILVYVQEAFASNQRSQCILENVKNNFPFLEKISIVYRPTGAYIKVIPYTPLCCINNSLILTDNKKLCPHDTFVREVIDAIAHITVAPECVSKVTSLVPPLLQELPSDFYETYTLELSNEHHVCLTNKQEKYFNILLSTNQKNISSLLSYCGLVKKDIIEPKGFDNGKKWIADVRFTDYIIVYRV